ncbi:MAG: PHP domain-containing protein [Desulfobulbus sp.]|nr:PHP domain-containing protein [Desulfobulbus sp.]
MCIDLHTHSIYSDGSCTPAELVALAVDSGLRGLSLTDHDTVEGVEEIRRLGTEAGLTVISGVEVSTKLHERTIHILGYGVDPANTDLQRWLVPLQEGRERRNAIIIQKLQGLGVDITTEEVETISRCGQTGRPHIARLLVAKGVVDSFDAAFRQYLGRNRPAWEARFSYSAAETIAMIHQTGGLAVLAHPGQIDPTMSSQPALIRELALHGLDGLELHYPTHTRRMKKQLKALAAELGLLMTGGSDFHGATRTTHHHLASKALGFCPPCSILGQLTARLAERHH